MAVIETEAFISQFKARLFNELGQCKGLAENFDPTNPEHHRRYHLNSCLTKRQIEQLCANIGTFSRLLKTTETRDVRSLSRSSPQTTGVVDHSPLLAVGTCLLPAVRPIDMETSFLLQDLIHCRSRTALSCFGAGEESKLTADFLIAELQQSVSEDAGYVFLRTWLMAVGRVRQRLGLCCSIRGAVSVLEPWQADAELAFSEILQATSSNRTHVLAFTLAQVRYFFNSAFAAGRGPDVPNKTRSKGDSLTATGSQAKNETEGSLSVVGVIKGAYSTTMESELVGSLGASTTTHQREVLKKAQIIGDTHKGSNGVVFNLRLVKPVILQVYRVRSQHARVGNDWMPTESVICFREQPLSGAAVDCQRSY